MKKFTFFRSKKTC